MGKVGGRLRSAPDRVLLRHRTHAQAVELREDVPHPMRTLAAAVDLCQRIGVIVRLRLQEPIEIERVGFGPHGFASTNAFSCKSKVAFVCGWGHDLSL